MKYTSLFLFVAFLAVGCAKYPADSVTSEETDLIGTLYDQSKDFSKINTYAIVDSVLLIDNRVGASEPDTVKSRYSDRVINLIAQNMNERGYTRVNKDSMPDVGIDALMLNNENAGSYTYWGGWPGYWGWGGWGYWYPWPQTTYYKYERGTVIVRMIDLANVDSTDQELTVVWDNVAGGLVSGSSNYDAGRIDRAINIMFDQSPYLKK